MNSSAFGVEGGQNDRVIEEVTFAKLKRNQNRLLCGLVVLTLLVLFCVAEVIWLSVEISENDDDETTTNQNPSVLTLASTGAPFENARPLFAGSGYWIEKEQLPNARSDHHAVAVDDFIYIIGGLDISDDVIANVTIYDTVLGIYTEGPSLPVPLHRFAHAYDDKDRKIYVFGGLSDVNEDALDTVYVLDIDNEEWTTGPSLLAPRSDLCGAFADGKVYAIGGYGFQFEATLDTVDALDVSTNEWTNVNSMPTPRGDCNAASMGGQVIVVGGYYDPTGQFRPEFFRNEVELYNPKTDTWEELAPMMNARGDKAVAVLPDDRLLVVGGETHNRGSHTEVATHHVEEYVKSENIWIDRAPLPYPTFRTSAAYVDGAVFVFGGHRTCTQGDEASTCIESDILQVYFDIRHPNVFIV